MDGDHRVPVQHTPEEVIMQHMHSLMQAQQVVQDTSLVAAKRPRDAEARGTALIAEETLRQFLDEVPEIVCPSCGGVVMPNLLHERCDQCHGWIAQGEPCLVFAQPDRLYHPHCFRGIHTPD